MTGACGGGESIFQAEKILEAEAERWMCVCVSVCVCHALGTWCLDKVAGVQCMEKDEEWFQRLRPDGGRL